ncbi:hypothetical protein J6590_068832 [Homalodisca vitripennis]|nr:hypothetical protein J6590_068832 [Homalodisca vitripennis]
MFVHAEPLLQRRMLRISCGRFAAPPTEAFKAYGSAYGRSQMFPLLRPIMCDHSVGAGMKHKLRRLAVVVGPSSPRSLIQSNDN